MGNPRRAAPIGRGIPVDRSVGAADNDFLQYNATSRKWEFVTAGEAGLLTAAANETITGDWIFQDQITIQDTGGTDSVLMQHNGTNFGMSFTNTSLWDVNLAGTNGVTFSDTGAAKFWVNFLNSRVEVHDGWPLRVYDSADTDYIDISDDGTLTRFTSNPNIMAFYPEGSASAKFSIRSAYAGPQGGAALRVWDAGSTDYAEFSHDGTDFNTAFTNTTEWNITGLSVMDLDAGLDILNTIESTSAGAGPTTAALYINSASPWVKWKETDQAANNQEWVAGASGSSWVLSAQSDGSATLEGNALVVTRSGTTITGFDVTATTATFTNDVEVGADLRIYDAGDTDYVEIRHDGTDLYFAYTNTRFEYHDNLTSGAIYLDGAYTRWYDSTNTDYIQIAHNGSNATLNWVNGEFQISRSGTGSAVVDLLGGMFLRVRNSANTDYMQMNHDGTDFHMNFVNTTWFRIGNSNAPTSGTLFRGGQSVRVYDTADNDYIEFAHTGTDAQINVHQTTDVDIDAAGNATGRLKFQTEDVHYGDFRIKDADLSRASTTTQTADDDLIGFSFSANTLYAVEIMLLVQSASGTPMFKWDFSFTNAPQDSGGGMHYFGGGAFGEQTNGDLTTDYLVTNNYTDEACIHFKGYVLTNATTGGTASFRWSQRVSNPTSTTLRRGSWVKFTKL